MSETLSIGSRKIGATEPALVIAEIGVNHDGYLARALQLVEIAASSGADAVKLQLFTARQLMHGSAAFAGYQADRCADSDPAAMLRRYELSADDVRTIVAAIRECGLIPLATPFSLSDVELVESLELPAIKIASPDLVNRPLLQRASRGGKPLLISTGAATMVEVSTAVGWLQQWQTRFALLHCVSSYPALAEHANLCWIDEMARAFGVQVGYSDHTTDVACGALAVAAGATIVEKHLTYDRSASGPDHSASADSEQFSQYVKLIRAAQILRGQAGKRVLETERDVRRVSRQSLVLSRDVEAGQLLGESDLTIQRPGTGIPAAQMAAAVGRKPISSLRAGTLLQWDMLGDAA